MRRVAFAKRCPWFLLIVMLALALAGCGEQAFKVTSDTASQKAPGHYVIPPKVDILLAEDDTGSLGEVLDQFSDQMPAFLQTLEAKGWDYHFAVTPLTNYKKSITQILSSRYDSNWGSAQWVAPYPGAAMPGPGTAGTIAPSFFTTPDHFSSFVSSEDIQKGGQEPGFFTIQNALSQLNANKSNFVRNDALLVIIVASTGQDSSGMPGLSSGFAFPQTDPQFNPNMDQCQAAPNNSWTSCKEQLAPTLSHYETGLKSFKENSAQLKFFAAVANTTTTISRKLCLGGYSNEGTRYKEMASALGGESYDICTTPITTVLESLSNNLQVQKKAFHTRYLFLDQEPDVSTIQVTKYVNGDPEQATLIQESEEDGWTYIGYKIDLNAIDYPIPMSKMTGYAIRLNGSSVLIGDDRADVIFKPAGVQDAAAE